MQTASLSASYDKIILKEKQVICLESLYLKKKICSTPYQPSSIALAKSAFRKFAYSARAVHEKEKIMQKSGLLEALPRRQFKEYCGISALVNLSAGG